MRTIKSLLAATLLLSLVNPALAQTDPHHPEGAETPAANEEAAPAEEGATAAPTAPVAAGSAANKCPEMMGMMGMMPMMQQGMAAKPDMSMMQMQMQMMQMMQMQMQMQVQMQMQMMQIMQNGNPAARDASP